MATLLVPLSLAMMEAMVAQETTEADMVAQETTKVDMVVQGISKAVDVREP